MWLLKKSQLVIETLRILVLLQCRLEEGGLRHSNIPAASSMKSQSTRLSNSGLFHDFIGKKKGMFPGNVKMYYSPGNLNTLSFPGNFSHGIKLNTVLHSPGTFPLFHSWGLFPKNGIWKLNTSSYWIRIIEHLFLTKYLCRELPLLLVEILVDWPIIGTAAGVGWPVVGEAATGWPVVVVASTIKISHYARVT